MALTKAKYYAVPETEQLPIDDEVHVKMAWNVVGKTKGLSDEQRKSARQKILARADELAMDTAGWDKKLVAAPDANDPYADEGDLNPPATVGEPEPKKLEGFIDEQEESDSKESMMRDMERQAQDYENDEQRARMYGMSLSAMALEFPEPFKDHPNQSPFKGVLTKLDEPSDNPLAGSHGKLVILPKAVAEEALPSLIGMAVDFTENFNGHDAQKKIGLITEANIKGNTIEIAGFFYGADFPSEVKRIQAEKSRMGFSFEAQAKIRSMNDDPLVIKNCVFTGAAVLYKDLAAYTTTSLSAKKMEIDEMTPELKKEIDDMKAEIAGLKTELAAAKETKKLEAGNVSAFVKPHSDALRACGDNMKAAGMGMHAKMGHVAMLHGMADQMDAEAALGKMPHIYQNYDFLGAAADKGAAKVDTAKDDAFKALTTTVEELKTQIVDLEKAKFAAAAEPERKTLSPAILSLLAKAGIDADTSGGKIKVADLDKAISKQGMSVAQRMSLKMNLQNAGKLEA